ncbi:MAG: hypothetical protein DRN01_03485 [Thermoplasmata archaeon]|nr:MAG: hypothetical protein DRN01_03485 [Thermoplasmata archaeon]
MEELKNPYKNPSRNQSMFNGIKYSMTWEDPIVIQKALNINKDDTLLSITSAGDNVLNLLLHNPERVISLDMNPCQNYLLELKMEAIKHLSHTEFLKLLGVTPSDERIGIYNSIRKQLPKEAQLFWDKNTALIKKGIIYHTHSNYRVFGRYLKFIYGEKTVKGVFKCETVEEQRMYAEENLYRLPWSLYAKIVVNPLISTFMVYFKMFKELKHKKIGTLREQYKTVFSVVRSRSILRMLEKTIDSIPLKDNYFVSLMLFGEYIKDRYPPYLKPESFPILKERVDRVDVKTMLLYDFLKTLPSDSITKFNLSNVFDLANNREFPEQLKEIVRVGKNKSRFCYFSLRRDREIPETLNQIKPEKKLSKQLLKEERTLLFNSFEIGEIQK